MFQCKDDFYAIHSELDSIGYHTILIDKKSNQTLGGGEGLTKEHSFRVAFSEMCERKVVKSIYCDTALRDKFYLNKFPTTCGFAFGFDELKTLYRSIFEAVERYLFSQWIDFKYFLPEIKDIGWTTPFFDYFSKFFDELKFFLIDLEISHPLVNKLKVKMGIVLGLTPYGIFPGSRINFLDGDVWDHAIVECWRHKKISEINLKEKNDDFLEKRIGYFSENKKKALSLIPKDHSKSMPILTPKFYVPQLYTDDIQKIFLWRNLCFNYLGWEQGGIDRFVY